MSIIRGERPQNGFYMLSNTVSGDKHLSWAARGLLIFLLSKPDHWEVSVAALVNETAGSLRGPGGHTKRDGVKAVLAELMDAGYMSRSDKPKHNADGSFAGYDYIVSDYPTLKSNSAPPSPDKPSTAEPSPVEPSTPNPTQVKTDSKEVLKKAAKTERGAPRLSLPEWLDPILWEQWVQHRLKVNRKAVTQHALELQLKELSGYQAAGYSLRPIVERSIAGGWSSFHLRKTDTMLVSSKGKKSLESMDYSTDFFS
jgi:hypothetical protein